MQVVTDKKAGVRLLPSVLEDEAKVLVNEITGEEVLVGKEAELHESVDGWKFIAMNNIKKWTKNLFSCIAVVMNDESMVLNMTTKEKKKVEVLAKDFDLSYLKVDISMDGKEQHEANIKLYKSKMFVEGIKVFWQLRDIQEP